MEPKRKTGGQNDVDDQNPKLLESEQTGPVSASFERTSFHNSTVNIVGKNLNPARPRSNSITSTLVKTLHALDLCTSKKLAVCADHGPLRPLMMLLELSGHGISWLGGCFLALYLTTSIPMKVVLFNLLLALFVDLANIALLKSVFRRPRPMYNKDDMFATVHLDKYSFPSGHATRAATVSCLLLTHLNLSLLIRICVAVWGILVGFSRVMLGRHHISDVGCGFFVGYVQFILVEKIWFTRDVILQFPTMEYLFL
uniref:Presqualene diphosphate phosphatase-like n=1 Tax=Phallusia mammillata TaxID=59560 RepID=A0A6F9DPZ7_9ASCI|nr:presqualene diphosphate phosphatase-like [Phallusia mammillata]